LPSPSTRPSSIHRPPSIPPFVDGLPPSPQPQKPILRRRLSAVHRRPSSTLCPAARGLRSAVHIRLFVPYSWTACLLPEASKAHPPPSAVCRPHSFIRFPSVDGLPSSPKPRKPILRRRLSAVHIRLFVPHSLTVCPPPRSLKSPSSAVGCLPSTFVYSFPIRGRPAPSPKPQKPILRRRLSAVHIRSFVPHSWTACPHPRNLESLSYQKPHSLPDRLTYFYRVFKLR
jgi:hypothetical protein